MDNPTPAPIRRKRPAPAGPSPEPSSAPDPSERPPGLRASMSCEQAFSLVALRCLDGMLKNENATARGDLDALHQMRVSITCLRTAVSFFSPMVADETWEALRPDIRWLNGHLGAARDLDVILSELRDHIGEHAADALNRQRSTGHTEVARALQSERYRRLMECAADWVGSGDWRDAIHGAAHGPHPLAISVYASRRLRQWTRRILGNSRDLASMDPETRHRLRIRAKRVRYAMEWFGEFLPGITPRTQREALRHLRRVQRSLGELNDAARAEALIAQHGVVEPAGQRFRISTKMQKRLLRNAQSAFQGLADIFDAG